MTTVMLVDDSEGIRDLTARDLGLRRPLKDAGDLRKMAERMVTIGDMMRVAARSTKVRVITYERSAGRCRPDHPGPGLTGHPLRSGARMGGRSEYPTVKKQPERPVLITDAARSQDEQFRSRQIRYVTMMGLRAACLIAGAILISAHPPLLPVWLIMCAAGMVILPWAAVLIANDRPARSKAERAAAAAAREQEQQAALSQHPVEEVEYITIDAEPVEGERWAPAEPERERKQR